MILPSTWSSVQDWIRIAANALNPFLKGEAEIAVTKLSVTPTTNSLNQGILITQSGPLSGSSAGPLNFNKIDVTVRSALTGTGGPGGASSATWASLLVTTNAGGANFDGVSVMGGAFGLVQDTADTSTADKNALASGVSIGASTPGKAYGASSGATVTSSGACAAIYGYETDVMIGSVSVPHAIGFNAWSGGTQQGSTTYSAYTLGISGTGGTAKWKTGMRLYTQGGATGSPVDSSFSWFDSDHTTTIGNVFNCSNVTVTGYILNFPNVKLKADGALTVPELAAASVSTPAASCQTLFIDTADHKLKRKDSAGTVTIIA